MDLYLHLGAHRTGSTAFQRILSKNAQAFARGGTVVWGPDELRKRDYFYLPLKDGFRDGAHEAYAEDVAALNARRLVISEENIIGTMLQNLRSRVFYPDFVRRMVDYGGMFNTRPTRIGLAIREYASFWESSYTYSLPRHPLPGFQTLRQELLAIDRGWLDMIRELRGLFPKTEIMVWPLETVQRGMRDMVGCFTDHPAGDLEDIGRRINASRGSEVVPFLHKLRAEVPGIKPDAIHEAILAADFSAAKKPVFFSDDEILRLAMRYAEDIAALEAGFEGVRLITKPGQCA